MFVDLVSVCTFLLKYMSVFLQKSCAVFGMSFITFFDGLTLDETFTDFCKINFEAAFLEITEAKLAILAHLSFNFFLHFILILDNFYSWMNAADVWHNFNGHRLNIINVLYSAKFVSFFPSPCINLFQFPPGSTSHTICLKILQEWEKINIYLLSQLFQQLLYFEKERK